MAIQNITELLHPLVKLEVQDPATVDPKQVSLYERLIGMRVPGWYLNFLETYGYVQCLVDNEVSLFLFQIKESQGYYQDYYDAEYESLDFRIPMGTDLGGRALFYSERDGESGIYVSYSIPDSQYFVFLAPNLETLLFDGIGLEKFANF